MKSGGFELKLGVHQSSAELIFTTDLLAKEAFPTPITNKGYVSVYMKRYSDEENIYVVGETRIDDNTVDRKTSLTSSIPALSKEEFSLRLFTHNGNISIFINEELTYWYQLSEYDWEINPSLSVSTTSDTPIPVTIVFISELSSRRQAIWVDNDSNMMSAIDSVIQQRPVLISPASNGHIRFAYDYQAAEKGFVINPKFVTRIQRAHVPSSGMSSDAIVFGEDVFVSSDSKTAEEEGLIVKVLKLSELDHGQEKASASLQKIGLESSHPVDIEMRFDPRVEIGDIIHVVKNPTSFEEQIDLYVFVEDSSFSISDGNQKMTISGRETLL